MHYDASFVIDLSPGWPNVNEPVIRAFSPIRLLGKPSGDFFSIRIYPETGDPWFAELEIGTKGDEHSEICNSYAKDKCFILAGGQVYLLNVLTRNVSSLDWYPITQLISDPYRRVTWLVGFWDITCVSSNGEFVWKSDRLASDDLRVLEIQEESFEYEGFSHGEIARCAGLLIEGRPAS